ncbi:MULTISPECIES: helix-turn-helix domain-containing protein [Nocardiopsis]|uniref:helix-turn-helix domain-containing protein n=1 Tax=Nocardiopsis TaxID=2013 RepID=UPI000345070E|nr:MULTISPECIES: AraC family transcriptional regulator [Nocardiopsis]PWV47302.1 AraC-like DNA-binding protein [Nocardiopsis sp. L17-MgMaSL7]
MRERADAVENRSLPSYGAGEIDVPYVVHGTDEVIARDTYWEEHSHPTHELLWNLRGASTATTGTRVWTITPSVGLWIPAGTPHSGWTPAGTWHHAAQFSVHAVPAIADTTVAVEVTPLLRLLLERLNTDGLGPGSRARTEAVVLDLLAPAPVELLLKIPESPLLEPIVAAVRDDPADDTTLASWAARLGVSTRTITRAFRAQTGLGFSQWSAAARVQHAITLLSLGEEIEEVAERVGYHSASAFGTVFRRVTGMSPGRFRVQ